MNGESTVSVAGAKMGDMVPTPGLALRFDERPLLVFWETTKACDLACVHCRAQAQPQPSPDELSTAEGRALIDELAGAGRPRPILVLTGGDCLKRPDIVQIAAHAQAKSVPVAIAPSVTPHLKDETLAALRHLGIRSASLSLDGAHCATHDGIRGVTGHFDATLAAVRTLQQHGFSVQINTTVMESNLEQLADVAILLHRMHVDVWEVFFLITTGRGSQITASTPAENENVCHFLVDASRYGFTVRTVEGPFFRRVAAERARPAPDEPTVGVSGSLYARLRHRLVDQLGPPTAPVRAPSAATRDGKGIIFVAANGDVHPSGFLPLSLGNVRDRPLLDIYRHHPVLKQIRRASFEGVCATCDHAQLCGGSRARAYASTGNPLGSDPGCLKVTTSGAA